MYDNQEDGAEDRANSASYDGLTRAATGTRSRRSRARRARAIEDAHRELFAALDEKQALLTEAARRDAEIRRHVQEHGDTEIAVKLSTMGHGSFAERRKANKIAVAACTARLLRGPSLTCHCSCRREA